MDIRRLKLIKNKDGHGTLNYKISLPKKWIDEMENPDTVLIELKNNEIIIKKEMINMLLIKDERVKNSLGNYVDYVLENGVELYEMDWDGEFYTNGYLRAEEKDTNETYKPVYRYQLENIDIEKIEENSDEWNYAWEIVGFEN